MSDFGGAVETWYKFTYKIARVNRVFSGFSLHTVSFYTLFIYANKMIPILDASTVPNT